VVPRPAGRRWANRRRQGEGASPGLAAVGALDATTAGIGATPFGLAEQQVSEAARLAAAAAGEPDAVRWLLDEVAPVVYGFVFARVGGDEAAAEDMLQETLLEAVRGAQNFRGESAASTWMCAIARRRLARHYESERRAEVARQSLRVVETVAAGGDQQQASELVERQDEVVRALGRLPAMQRQVLVLKYLEEMSVIDIAAQVGRSRVQVQSLLQRGREGLRRQLGGECG
jgi:RNA polymerase sigma-70 factor (ECF subfamily)